MAQVIDEHPSVASQRAVLGGAEAAKAGAGWQYFPTPTVTVERAGSTANDPSYQGSSTVVNVGLRQLLWAGGRLQAGTARAQANVAATEAAVQEAQQQLALRVLQAWGDWLISTRKLAAYEQGLALHDRLLRQVSRRVQEGQAAPSDSVLAQGRLAGLRAEHSALQLQVRVGLAKLGALLGHPISPVELTDAEGPAPAPLAQPLTVEDLMARAQQQAPALVRLRAAVDALAATVDERKADLQPEVYARLERQIGNYSQAQDSAQTRVFVGLSSRFGAGLSSFSAVDEARSRQAAAQAEIEVTRLALDEQVLLDFALLQQAQARITALREAITGAQDVLDSWDRQYLAGRKTWQDLMSAAREVVQSEAQLADAQGAELVAGWRLAVLTRGLPDLLTLTLPTRTP
jgi:adhesin transport system outer membrane protein